MNWTEKIACAFICLAAAAAQAAVDVTGLEPRLWMTFDSKSLANAGTGTATWTDEGTATWSPTPCGYAIDTSAYVPYATYSGVFTASHASSIAIVATLSTKSTAIMVHFKYSNTELLLRRGTTPGSLVLTRDSSTSPVITVNDIEDGDTEYHLYVVNIKSNGTDLYVDGELKGSVSSTPYSSPFSAGQLGSRHGGAKSGESKFGGLIDDLRVYPDVLTTEQMIALGTSLGVKYMAPLTILPIPDQCRADGAPLRPEFVVTNQFEGQSWRIGGDISSELFDVEYANNTDFGIATVTATVKSGELAGTKARGSFNINSDEYFSFEDPRVRRLQAGDGYVYVISNAISAKTFTAKTGVTVTDLLLVGGGGSGGNTMGGGGGGGGVVAVDGLDLTCSPGEVVPFTVGAGGKPGSGQNRGSSGGNSVITLNGTTYTAVGGGAGGSWGTKAGVTGGSGGGGCNSTAGGSGTAGQGNAGATAGNNSRSGGGGGAGHAGYAYTNNPNLAGNGGEGVTNDITGVEVVYGGGGGGGGSTSGFDGYSAGSGGIGGGGNGGSGAGGTNGTDGLGGGGGGGGWNGSDKLGGTGGCGTLILAVKPTEYAILPIPVQRVPPDFEPRVGFVVTNFLSGARWEFGAGGVAPDGCPFEASYGFVAGIGTVTATGKSGSGFEGVTFSREFPYTDQLVVNGGFEDVVNVANNYATAIGWTGGNTGNGSCGYAPNNKTTIINGTWCAIIQMSNYKEQVFTNDVACNATLTWRCKHRTSLQSDQPMYYTVTIDGEVVHPEEGVNGDAVRERSESDIVLQPGEHVIRFQGRTASGVDQTLFLDDVSLTAVSTNRLMILPIADQSCAEGACRPEFVVSNLVNGCAFTAGGDIVHPLLDVEYTNNAAIGTATVKITGKGDFAGEARSRTFAVSEDENIVVGDGSGQRIAVDGSLVYVFTNAAAAQAVVAKRSLKVTDCLLVGGGGAGGNSFGGGGGGGGVLAFNDLALTYSPGDAIPFTVGAGGKSGTSRNRGGNGGDTIFTFDGFPYTAKGGGGGGGYDQKAGSAGGSGGGGCCGGAGGAGTEGQGFAGANSGYASRSGGGGGAGHVGYTYTDDPKAGGNGGEGVTNDITGVWTYYGGGGGGGGSMYGWDEYDRGYGGLGGGGDGIRGGAGMKGTDGLGGGGGGSGWWNNTYYIGGAGGSGAVILKLKVADLDIDPIPVQTLAGGGCTPDLVVRVHGSSAVLTKGVDYEVVYANNTAAGTATVTVNGLGPYEGKVGYASFVITSRYYAKPEVAEEGDGTSWATAMSVTNLFATLATIDAPCEIWIAAGTVPAAALSITNLYPLAIYGGFAGTETTLAERPEGTLTVFDGTHTANCNLRIENPLARATLEIDRLKFCNARQNGFIKTGLGSLKVSGCVIEGNGKDVGTVYGRGMNVQGGGTGTLVVTNCVFGGNRNLAQDNNYGGFGIYIKSFASALVDNSLFVTNGYDLVWPYPYGSGYTWNGYNSRGSAILVENTPVTVRNTRFAGNVCPVRTGSGDSRWAGGVIALSGSSGGSVIDHCTFIGNSEVVSYQAPEGANCCGALVVNLANAADKVKVDNCTFAYNVTHGGNSAGGITVVKGDVEVDNTILWKNTRLHVTRVGYGSDVQVQSTGSLRIKNSLVTTLDGTGLVAVNPGSLVVDEDSVIAADPKLVTSTAAFTNLLTVTASQQYYKSKIYDDVVAMDAHLRSPAGYFVNGGAAGPATTDYSPAIDLGDSTADYSNEPAPNGSRRNAGAFGNTEEASCTATGQPEATVAVLYPDGMTRPTVQVAMGLESGSGYSATVQISCTTNGVFLASQTWHGVGNGDVLELGLPYYLANGSVFGVTVRITATNAEPVEYLKSDTVEGDYPPYYGKGGGSNVIHVRTGANCLMDGTSWTDAYPDLATALASAPDASKTELWLAVTNDYMTKAVTLGSSLTVRGGFAGVENSADERPDGVLTWLDGNNVYRTLDFVVPATATVTVERVRFSHSSQSELKKTGAGDLVVRDCLFTDANTAGMSGRGLYATGGTLSVTNCQFLNLIGPNEQNADGGNGIFMSGCTAATVDDCLFATNGTGFKADGAWCRHQAAAVRVNSTPAVFRNCRFAACAAALREAEVGGIVYFSGASGGSKMINCALVGNTDSRSMQMPASTTVSGAIAVNMSATNQTVDVENCTVAYNLSQAALSSAGITVAKGTVNLKNSIVYGNVRGRKNNEVAGADIHVRPNGVLNMSYTLVTGLDTNYVAASEGGVINIGDGVRELAGLDPLMVTTTNDFRQLFKSDPAYWYMDTTAARAACAAFDVHLRSHIGYRRSDGKIVSFKKQLSPAIDAGDKKSDCSREPAIPGVGGNGHRVNLGAYGNTPEAAMSPFRGSILILR